MAEYTKGKLYRDFVRLFSDDGKLVAGVGGTRDNGDVAVANADRLIACWNACESAGLTTDSLNGGMIERLITVFASLYLEAEVLEDEGPHREGWQSAKFKAILKESRYVIGETGRKPT